MLDVAHSGHVELLTPATQVSLAFSVDVMGIPETPTGEVVVGVDDLLDEGIAT